MGSNYSASADTLDDIIDPNGVSVTDYSGNIKRKWVENNAQTGDLLLFSGSSLFSQAIKAATGTPWTHVAIVIKDEKKVFVLQSIYSTSKPYYDQLTKSYRDTGVMLNSIEDVIDEDVGKIYYRKFHADGNRIFHPNAVETFLERVKGKPYEDDPIVLISSPNRSNKRKDSSSYFCSEIVYEFLYKTKWIDEKVSTKNPQNVIPSDFAYDKEAPFRLKYYAKYGGLKKIE